ncbi:helix-turn-helix domain-containing protein [Marininema halotolerans]|uniref:Crp-like helix-turn-helix domain-containing protein n=1 Tax=Marininema halotolerans TaxID=1155944 RepID=A0A1I6Q4I6_9BACL|nr:helix-turn-helix domain-containing protein [Marininema halotolerans]SFS47399.1 Crp-like helix-turn-helix domain-containing protein [Marininema halotolerans]
MKNKYQGKTDEHLYFSDIRRYYDENGEERISAPADTHKVISLAQSEAYKRKVALKDRGKVWVACYHEPIRSVVKKLTLIEAGAIIKLLPYLRFKSEGRLINEGKPLKQKDIQKVLGRGKKATSSILNKLKKLGIIEVDKIETSNEYRLNSGYHSMGFVEKAHFTKLYQVKTREIIENLTISQTGMLYKLLPFFHYERYFLCANPNEKDPEFIRLLTREDLAVLTGHSRETVSRMMNALCDEGVIMQLSTAGVEAVIVHPDVMFRLNSETEHTRVVRKQFEHLRQHHEQRNQIKK